MTTPPRPDNPRVVYPDGRIIPIRKMWYGARIRDTHVWIAEDPQFVPWVPGACTEYDSHDSEQPHVIVVGFDVEGLQY